MELERYEVEAASPDGLWSIVIELVPALLYGESYYGRLICTPSGQWEGRWLASDGQHGQCVGDDVADTINLCMNDYRGRRLTWGRSADGLLH